MQIAWDGGKMPKLLIKRCPDRMMWYRDKVGEVVPLLGQCSDGYWSREDAGYKNIVRFADAEVVE